MLHLSSLNCWKVWYCSFQVATCCPRCCSFYCSAARYHIVFTKHWVFIVYFSCWYHAVTLVGTSVVVRIGWVICVKIKPSTEGNTSSGGTAHNDFCSCDARWWGGVLFDVFWNVSSMSVMGHDGEQQYFSLRSDSVGVEGNSQTCHMARLTASLASYVKWIQGKRSTKGSYRTEGVDSCSSEIALKDKGRKNSADALHWC